MAVFVGGGPTIAVDTTWSTLIYREFAEDGLFRGWWTDCSVRQTYSMNAPLVIESRCSPSDEPISDDDPAYHCQDCVGGECNVGVSAHADREAERYFFDQMRRFSVGMLQMVRSVPPESDLFDTGCKLIAAINKACGTHGAALHPVFSQYIAHDALNEELHTIKTQDYIDPDEYRKTRLAYCTLKASRKSLRNKDRQIAPWFNPLRPRD